jgi:excisionase family DNA binding protein
MDVKAPQDSLDTSSGRLAHGRPGAVAASDHCEVLPAVEAARLLGVSRWTLYAAARAKIIPCRRLGRRMLFSRRALLAWLLSAEPGFRG